jgi:hypothetical protein
VKYQVGWRGWTFAVIIGVLVFAALYAASEYGESKIENHENSLMGSLMPGQMPGEFPSKMGEQNERWN